MKHFLAGIVLAVCAMSVHAQSVGKANHGHHSGGNHGALGMAAGAGGAIGAAASGGGYGRAYAHWYLHQSVVDNYQPWPEEEMRQFQKE